MTRRDEAHALDMARLAAAKALREIVEVPHEAEILMIALAVDMFANALALYGVERCQELVTQLNKHEMMRIMWFTATVTVARAFDDAP